MGLNIRRSTTTASCRIQENRSSIGNPLCFMAGVERATPRLNREVTVAEQTEDEKPQFKTPMPQTPTTKILAVGTFAPGTDMSQVQRILPTEVRETTQL